MCSPACFLDDGNGDSDLLPEEDEDEDQDQQQQCTNNTYRTISCCNSHTITHSAAAKLIILPHTLF